MASYVEQAILRVKDDSTTAVKRINRELASLFKTAKSGRDIKIKVSGLDRAAKEAAQLRTALMKLPTSRTVKLGLTGGSTAAIKDTLALMKKLDGQKISVPVSLPGMPKALADLREMRSLMGNLNSRTVSPKVSGPVGGGYGPRRGDAPMDTFGDGWASGFSPAQMGRDMARSFVISASHEMYQIMREVVKAGVVAPADRESALRKLELSGLSPEEINVVDDIAKDVASKVEGVPVTVLLSEASEGVGRTKDIMSPGGQADIGLFLTRMAENIAIIRAFNPEYSAEQAAEQSRQFEKALVGTGGYSDPQESEKLMGALRQAYISTGGDITGAEFKRAVQQLSTMGGGIGEASLLQVLLNRDEGGMRDTGEVRQFYEDMVRGNIEAEDRQLQISRGLRDKEGRSTVAGDFRNDMLGMIEAQLIPSLTKAVPGIDLTNKEAVMAALDNELGFVKQAGIGWAADQIVGLEAKKQEYERALRTTPEAALQNQTTREAIAELQANFNDLSAQSLAPLLPAVKTGIETMSGSMAAITEGTATPGDYATLAAAAVPVALGAGLTAMLDPATRPLGAAGIALTSSAVALDAAAVALTASAGVKTGAGIGAGAAAAGGGIAGFLKGLIAKAGVLYGGYLGASAVSEGNRKASQMTTADIDKLDRGLKDVLYRWTGGYMGTSAGETDALRATAPGDQVGSGSLGATVSLADIIRPAFFQDAAKPMETTFNTGAAEMAMTFSTGATELLQVGPAIDVAAGQFGVNAGAGLLPIAAQFGQIVGEAAMRAIGNVGVTVNAAPALLPAPRMDTGTSRPF